MGRPGKPTSIWRIAQRRRRVWISLEAKNDAHTPEIEAVLKRDIEDLTALNVTKTPTFLVNGRSLPTFGDVQLKALVAEEVAKTRK